MLTRRRLLTMASAALPLRLPQRARDGHLNVTPRDPKQSIQPGEHALGLGNDRDGLLIIPKNYRPDTPAPLAVMLHGASGHARRIAGLFAAADEFGVILLAPESRGSTWDAIRGRYGPDLDFLDRAIGYAFDHCAIDRRHMAIGGFSDGASYGLSLGLANGDLFTHVIACSPGFVIPGTTRGRPAIFISHGTADQILPFATTSMVIVGELQRNGYAPTFREFDGPHTVPPQIAKEAFSWFLGR
jgi:phospholipase/carboxylesterase